MYLISFAKDKNCSVSSSGAGGFGPPGRKNI